MANMCSNFLWITGDEKKGKKVFRAFESLLQDNDKNGQQLPGVKMDSWFYNISVNDGQINFETRHGAEVEDMRRIAKHFGVDFEMDYQEDNSGVYGKITFKDGEFTNVYLDNDEIDEIVYDERAEQYSFRGTFYDSDSLPLEFLLEEKIAKLEPTCIPL